MDIFIFSYNMVAVSMTYPYLQILSLTFSVPVPVPVSGPRPGPGAAQFISPEELQKVLKKLGLPEAGEIEHVEKMIVSVDSNHDGRVDFFEFKNMMQTVLVPSS